MGCFVRGVKKWHGMFCPGMFCPAPVKTARSICQKVVNTGLYESEWLIEIFKRPFWWLILGQVLRSIY